MVATPLLKTITRIILKKFVSRPPVAGDLRDGEIVFNKFPIAGLDNNLAVGNPDAADGFGLWKPKRRLTREFTVYVDPVNGDDITYDGTLEYPFATVARATQYIKYDLDQAGFAVVLKLLNGVYPPFQLDSLNNVRLVGNPASPINVVVDPNLDPGFGSGIIVLNSTVSIDGLRIRATTSIIKSLLVSQSYVSISNMQFGAIGVGALPDPGGHIFSANGALVTVLSATAIGSAYSFLYGSMDGKITMVAANMLNNPNFNFFATAILGSTITMRSLVAGTATGGRANSSLGSIINGQNFYPAGTLGTVADTASGGFVK